MIHTSTRRNGHAKQVNNTPMHSPGGREGLELLALAVYGVGSDVGSWVATAVLGQDLGGLGAAVALLLIQGGQ